VDQAGPAHAPFDDLGQPHRIQLVGLGSAGHVLDVLGVEQPALEALGLQQVEHRLPVVGGGLHRHQLDLPAVQPAGQAQQRRRGRGVLPYLLHPPARLGLVRHPHAHHQPGFADVDRAHPLDQPTGSSVDSSITPAFILDNSGGWPPAGTVRGKR